VKRVSKLGVLGMYLLMAVAAGASGAEDHTPQTILKWQGHRMFEDFSARSEISPDGRWVLRTFVDGNQALLSLPDGRSDDGKLEGGVREFERAAWCGNELLRLGSDGHERRWFESESSHLVALPIPPEAMPVCSQDKRRIAHYTSYAARAELPPPKSIFVGNRGSLAEVGTGGVVMVAHFSPDGNTLYAVARQDDGASSLLSIAVDSRTVTTLARDLDAWPFPGPELAVSADGRSLILPLATTKHPVDAERQIPHRPDRWLKLYRFDLASRHLSLLQEGARADQTDPAVAAQALYWVGSHTSKRVMAVPADGGPMHVVVSGGEQYLPTWSRDGKRLAFVVGDYRLADWALTQDVDILPVDSQASAVGGETSFIVGNHEDFPPDWSRDGKWIAWHSHRAEHDPPYYDAPGTSDDIWVRRAEDVHASEIRATHGVWETGWAYWSPDGREILYTSWDRNGTPGIYQVRITTFDPGTGNVGSERRLSLPQEIHSPQIAIWSPSGSEIAIEDAASATERVLWIVSKDGKRATRVARYPSETYGGIDWMPDGQRLVYAGLDGARMQIFSIARAGGAAKRLSDGQGNYLNPRVSPDGRWIACSEVETEQTLLSMPFK
jgi:Tol biopolymer transport system component